MLKNTGSFLWSNSFLAVLIILFVNNNTLSAQISKADDKPWYETARVFCKAPGSENQRPEL
jgi:hypothetical protein